MLSVDSKVDVGHSAFQSDRKFKDEDGGNLIHGAVGPKCSRELHHGRGGDQMLQKKNQININVKTMNKNKQKWNLEHDEVGGPPGEHDDGLVGQGGVHHLVCHKLGV